MTLVTSFAAAKAVSSSGKGRWTAMNVCCLQHVPFEGPGHIAAWAAVRDHEFTFARPYLDGRLPCVTDFDLLVVMGGPMSVHDEAAHPWLVAEKRLIARCLAAGKFVLGVCLGSQLLAEVLGARVYRNQFKEIGWFPLAQCMGESASHLFRSLPPRFTGFHWHGETYDLPPGTAHLASSTGCRVQAFEHPYALGLQFHLEVTPEGLAGLIRECSSNIGSGPYEQTPEQILAGADHCGASENMLVQILDSIEARVENACRLGI
ncbi:MAG: type 1 glutamine amidotransferase [Acidobacteria bacterium]|nr:type 1 glutamine amidotransferase [Acidobacteriota bacterium]